MPAYGLSPPAKLSLCGSLPLSMRELLLRITEAAYKRCELSKQ